MSTQETSLLGSTVAIYKSANPIAPFCYDVRESAEGGRNDTIKY